MATNKELGTCGLFSMQLSEPDLQRKLGAENSHAAERSFCSRGTFCQTISPHSRGDSRVIERSIRLVALRKLSRIGRENKRTNKRNNEPNPFDLYVPDHQPGIEND